MNRWLKVSLLLVLSLLLGLGGCAAEQTAPPAPKPTVNRALYGQHVTLTGTSNTQDLGGIRTKTGQILKAHRLLRSDQLSELTQADRRRLTQKYQVRAIADLRSTAEIKDNPDVPIPHVTYHQDSVVTDNYNVRTTQQFYQGLVTDRVALRGYSAFFDQLLQRKTGATVFHCTYGKDRTGVGALLVLSALGVSRKTILQNYLYSNQNLAQDAHIQFKGQANFAGKSRRRVHHIRRVKRANLEAVYQRINAQYGSMTHFLRRLGLTPAKQKQLQRLYLTQ
ncbi:tyrosine-protein phosphatase [Levilactobacillus namurensis]|uniref:Tyrosine-protein phosphatase n=1 Tax=Levilactobacillus namurensis TaxID=380393 RepID=A0AAW8W6T6_9LACO|nr:tyrosine-protein phosphatase [Levilactobacillus namurensis]MDT7013971.1 tyrosine-protein phosphatase [Levilactobacillus namurensis]